MADFRYYDHSLDITKHEIRNGAFHVLAAAPASPVKGQFYFNDTDKVSYQWDGTQWIPFGGGGVGVWKGAGATYATLPALASAKDGDICALTADTIGTGTSGSPQYPRGVYKRVSGVWTLEANLSTGAISDPFQFKGGIDASTNPNYPAANAGDLYRISVAGKLGGAAGIDVNPNDTVYCFADNTATGDHATVGNKWVIIHNPVSSTVATNQQLFDQTDPAVVAAPTSMHGYSRKQAFNVGDGAAKSFTVTHTFNSIHLDVTVYDVALKTFRHPSVEMTSPTTVVVSGFTTAPAANNLWVMLTENQNWT
jgi:hypothetical protein